MKKNSIKILVGFIIATTLFACNKGAKFQKTETGIEYKFIVQNKDAKKPAIGDGIVLDVEYYHEQTDSLMFSSKEISEEFKISFVASTYEGSIDEAFALLGEGDSAIFIIDAVKFFKNATDIEIPAFIKEGDRLTFYIKLKDILSQEEVLAEKEEYHKMKLQEEQVLIAEYLTKNGFKSEPTESGLYYIEKEKGRGAKVKIGDSVAVQYTGYFINGEVFDSSKETGEPFKFKVGAGNVSRI